MSAPVGTRQRRVRASRTGFSRAIERAHAWFAAQRVTATPFQLRVFDALTHPGAVLVVAPTGSGKTAAVMLPLLGDLDDRLDKCETVDPGVRILYVAPVRALADAVTARLCEMNATLGTRIRVAARTGDTTPRERHRMRRAPPHVLVTTPETLAVMLATETRASLSRVECVVLDELHLLAAGKRGALFASTLAVLDEHLRGAGAARARRLAMTATAGDPLALARWMQPETRIVEDMQGPSAVLTFADPPLDSAFPSAGWAWRVALPTLARAIASSEGTSLVFVSARARAEQWTLALRDVLPTRMAVACFHGSLSTDERKTVAQGLDDHTVRAVVSTSGLEVGVDLPAVARVLMVGASPSATRLLQAAGRADHRPGTAPAATVIPTGAMDLVRAAAAMQAARHRAIEAVDLRAYDLDVAVQGALARVALGPCTRDDVARTLRATWPFADLDDDDIDDVLCFLCTGGDALAAYPELARVVTDGTHYTIANKRSLRRYLQAIGTIVGDVSVPVRNRSFTVGQVEGRFAALLEVGDVFVLGARSWRVASLGAGEVQVRHAHSGRPTVPSWAGSRAAMSEQVSTACEALWGALDEAACDTDGALSHVRKVLGIGDENGRAVLRLIRAQRAASRVPTPAYFVVECIRDHHRDHLVAYTFAGSTANELIARVVAVRVRRATGAGCEVAATEEAMCITSTALHTLDEATLRACFDPKSLLEDLLDSLDGGVLAAAYFREVARVAQLWTPERRRGAVTPGLLYDVLRKHDPDHVLLRALRYTLYTSLEGPRAERCLSAIAVRRWYLTTLDGPSAMSIPVVVWATRDAVAPDDPESALAAAAHALFERAARSCNDKPS